MGMLGILLLAFGEAMDAFAVAVAAGVAVKDVRAAHVVKAVVVFGGFQGVMPAFGCALGALVGPRVEAFDHWIAFAILLILGVLALKEAFAKGDDDEVSADVFSAQRLLLLGVATSIDAFAVGVTLPMIGAPLALSCVVIGVVTGVLCGVGVVVGARVGALVGKGAEFVGGAALISMGCFILYDGLTTPTPTTPNTTTTTTTTSATSTSATSAAPARPAASA